jgi:hypothetical protein
MRQKNFSKLSKSLKEKAKVNEIKWIVQNLSIIQSKALNRLGIFNFTLNHCCLYVCK